MEFFAQFLTQLVYLLLLEFHSRSIDVGASVGSIDVGLSVGNCIARYEFMKCTDTYSIHANLHKMEITLETPSEKCVS